jgi:hypothetical protein
MNIPFRAQIEAIPFGPLLVNALQTMVDQLQRSPIYCGGTKILSGKGSPEGVVRGSVGDLYLRTDGTAGATLYVKESGTELTGWSGV